MMRRLLIVFPLILSVNGLAGAPSSAPRRRLIPVQLPGTNGWKAVGTSAEKLAARFDTRLGTLKNAVASSVVTLEIPSGRGQSFCRSVIERRDRFRIEVIRTSNAKYKGLTKAIFRGQNGKVSVLTEAGWLPRGATKNFAILPPPLLRNFLTRFDDTLLRGTQGGRPVTQLVKEARAAKWRVSAERRPKPYSPEIRFVFEAPAGKRKGQPIRRYAVSFNEANSLPTQVHTEDGAGTRILWSCAWGVKRTPLTPKEIATYNPASPESRR